MEKHQQINRKSAKCIAVNAEKNSIVFYVGLKDLVPARSGKDKVEAIMKEEMSHLTKLNQALAALE